MTIWDFLKNRRILKTISRFNMETILHKQNLCEHGFNVANLYIFICEMLGFSYTTKEIFLVMNHDFSECYTGDLNLHIKNKIPHLWEEIENDIIPKHIPTDSDIKQYFKEYSTPEKYDLFLFADAFDAYLYCFDEKNLGNKFMIKPFKYYYSKLIKMNPVLFFQLIQNLLEEKSNDNNSE